MRHSIKCKKENKTDYTKNICSRVENGGEITLGPENYIKDITATE